MNSHKCLKLRNLIDFYLGERKKLFEPTDGKCFSPQINPFFLSFTVSISLEEEQKMSELLKKMEKEKITFDDISAALVEIGVTNLEAVLSDCKEVIKSNRKTLRKRYLHSEEEAVLITTYTYSEDNEGDEENTPYRKLNTKLWDDNIQDQLDNPKSYLRLLLRALRKLPRTRPQTLFRGIKNYEHVYEIGEELIWKGFSSTSTSMRVTKLFLTNKVTRKVDGTLFEIRKMWGYNIFDFSEFRGERGKNDNQKY